MNKNGNGAHHYCAEDLNEVELCYTAAFLYGLRLIDEKAAKRGELVISLIESGDFKVCRCEPEIDVTAMRDFVQRVGTRIMVANNL